MSKEKKILKEYAIVVSLILFFAILIITGAIRVYLITKDKIGTIDLETIDIIEVNTNIDMSSYNLRIANSIRQKYDVDVYYSDDTSLASVNAVAIKDDVLVFDMLKAVNDVLEEYPEELIREIEAKRL